MYVVRWTPWITPKHIGKWVHCLHLIDVPQSCWLHTFSTIDHVWKVQQQPLYRQIPALVETLPCYHDCFVTSWSFPLSEIHFGLSAPCSFYPGMFPRIPWTAIVLNDVNSDGIYIHMCLPSPAYDVFQSEPALHDHVNGIRVVDIPEWYLVPHDDDTVRVVSTLT